MPCCNLHGERVHIRPDPHAARSTRGVVSGMRIAFVLKLGPFFRVPGLCSCAGLGVKWNSCVIANFRTGSAFRLILVLPLPPFAGEIDLSEGWKSHKHRG